MTMTVFLEVQIRDDVAADTVEAAIRETLAQTAARQGNESLEVLVDDEDPTRMVVLERWTTAEDHDAYVAWRATPEGAARLGEVLAAPPVTRVFSGRIALAL